MNVKFDHFALLKSIPRKKHRSFIKSNDIRLPFFGKDIWTLYEVSWLNRYGIPEIYIAKIEINATSTNIVESKSLKIYINSFHQIIFNHKIKFIEILKSDLTKCVDGKVSINLFTLKEIKNENISEFNGFCIDNQAIKINSYKYNPLFLLSDSKKILKESLYSNLLKSNCPKTNQPDWASIQIIYTGKKINHASLLCYLISFRHHGGFHEECVERIFCDIETVCRPQELSVYARYTRRGGIDINPWRSNTIFSPNLIRTARQ